jgi:predicted secreted hydrolase
VVVRHRHPAAAERLWGFQVTFFRASTGVDPAHPSRFAARELVFGHAALTDVAAGQQWHDQRVARAGFGAAGAAEGHTDVTLRDWRLRREGTATAGHYTTRVHSPAAGFTLDLVMATTQPPLLQGIDGWSQKGPDARHFSHYYSEPQLAVRGALTQRGRTTSVAGKAWLDHEWSAGLLPPEAMGWDWIGMNLDDGSALTVFRVRQADGSALHAGGSLRRPGGEVRAFDAGEVAFTPGRTWQSPASQARYPVEWTIDTPVGRFQVAALLDAQELDSRASTGAWYWEGLSDLRGTDGQRVGRGYLEMTGYARRLLL